jgi:hypothetical protein
MLLNKKRDMPKHTPNLKNKTIQIKQLGLFEPLKHLV